MPKLLIVEDDADIVDLIAAQEDTYSKDLLLAIRNMEEVTSCIVHRIMTDSTQIPADYLSDEVQTLGLEKLNSSFIANESGFLSHKSTYYHSG